MKLFTRNILVFGYEDLLISVGGYLGLFIGMSLNDVTGYIIDFIARINKKVKLF